METADILRAFAVAAAFICTSFAVPAAAGSFRRLQAASRADRRTSAGRGGFADRLLRNGIAPATALMQRLSRNARVASYCERLCWLVRLRGYRTDAARVGGIVAVAAVAAIPVGLVLSSSAVFGIALAFCLVIALGIVARQAHERWVEQMREEVPDMLHAMSACFHAGYSLLQSFHHLAGETPGALGDLFRRAESELRTGVPADEVLRRMREDSAVSELAFVTAALEVQHHTGGSMQKVLDSACESVEGQLALRRSLRVQTAQARLSMRIVTIMPFVLVGVFSLASPDFLMPFFSSALGVAALCTAICMQLAGILAIRRMLSLDEA